MLDYDAMRSKVKKLVEKPDKDPSKLPRTEKETEMVMSASEFIRTSHLFEEVSPSSALHHDLLYFPSPSKAVEKAHDGLKQRKKYAGIQEAEEDTAKGTLGLRRSASMMNRMARASSLLKNTLLTVADVALGSPIEPESKSPPGWEEHHPRLRSPVLTKTPPSADTNRHSGHFHALPVLREASKDSIEFVPVTPSRHSHLSPNMQRVLGSPSPGRHISMPVQPPSRDSVAVAPLQLFSPANRNSLSSDSRTSHETRRSVSSHSRNPSSSFKASSESARPLLPRNTSSSRKSLPAEKNTRVNVPTPFFEPSELEDIMAPFRQRFAEEQADLMEQAKAAYEQLNQQLTDELPQLIDLRYAKPKQAS